MRLSKSQKFPVFGKLTAACQLEWARDVHPVSNQTSQQLLSTLQMSRDYAKSSRALLVAEGAFCQAFSGGAVLLYEAAELPDAAGELPPEHSLAGPPDLTPGYVSLDLSGPVLADGQRYFDWVERGTYHDAPPGGATSTGRKDAGVGCAVVRAAFERKYARRRWP